MQHVITVRKISVWTTAGAWDIPCIAIIAPTGVMMLIVPYLRWLNGWDVEQGHNGLQHLCVLQHICALATSNALECACTDMVVEDCNHNCKPLSWSEPWHVREVSQFIAFTIAGDCCCYCGVIVITIATDCHCHWCTASWGQSNLETWHDTQDTYSQET